MGRRVVAQDHGCHGMRLTGLTSGVDQQQEGAAEQPAPAGSVQRKRDPKDGECQTTGASPQSAPGPRPMTRMRCLEDSHVHHPTARYVAGYQFQTTRESARPLEAMVLHALLALGRTLATAERPLMPLSVIA